MQKGNAACEAKGVLLAEKFEAAVSRARAQLESANAAMNRVKDKGSANLGVWRSQPAFDAEYQRASSEYEAARKHFDEAQRSRLESDFNEVAKAADRAKEMSGSLERDLTAAMEGSAGSPTRPTRSDGASRTHSEIDAEIETKAKYLDPALRAIRADGQKALENAREQLDPRRLSDSTLAAARSSVTEGAGLLTEGARERGVGLRDRTRS